MDTNPDSQVIEGLNVTTGPIQEYFEGEFTVVEHEHYNSSPGSNDIALIKLHHPAKTNQANIGKIRLPFNIPTLPAKVLATGFGRTENYTVARILRKGSMKVVQRDECLRQYNEVVKEMRPITDKQFCIKENNRGLVTVTCEGDSGSPVQYLAQDGGKQTWIQFGITSFGSGTTCGYKTIPTVAVNVYSYLDWILDNAVGEELERE